MGDELETDKPSTLLKIVVVSNSSFSLLCFLLKFSRSASASSSSPQHPTTTKPLVTTTAGNSRDNDAPVPSVLPPTPTTYSYHSILKLTPDTIREVIQNSNVLIYFHEPSCTHCRRFTSTFNQPANTLPTIAHHWIVHIATTQGRLPTTTARSND